jgi:hypothetical protein
MTLPSQLDRWKEQGAITPEQHALLTGLSRDEPCSLFLPLNFLLYAGVFALIGGLGWTVQTYAAQLGDVLVVTALTAILAGALWYCFTHAPTMVLDYVLYLGCLTWSLELAYIETHFHLLSGQWDNYLLATACFFFALAYRFDNRFVLSLALSTLAGWFGITISRLPGTQEPAYRQYAILYGLLVAVAGIALRRFAIKPHFFGTWLNVAANVLLAAVLSGVFERDNYLLWFPLLLVGCGAALAYGLAQRQFVFIAYAALYGYIGVSSILIRGMSGATAILSYFVVTGIAMLVTLIVVARRFGRES